MRTRRHLLGAAALLAALAAISACSGGGTSTAVPRAANATSASTSAPSSSMAKGAVRVGASFILGGPLGRQVSTKVRRNVKGAVRPAAHRRAAGTRSPQYINEDYTDYITVYVGSGSPISWDNGTPFDVSVADVGQGGSACVLLKSGNERECALTFSAPAGSDTFYFVTTCDWSISCGYVGTQTLAVGVSVPYTIVSGGSQQIDVTLDPVLSPLYNGTLAYGGSAAVTLLSAFFTPSVNGQDYVSGLGFDGGASGPTDLGPLNITAFDASATEAQYLILCGGDCGETIPTLTGIPATKPNPDPNALVSGVAPTVTNSDPFLTSVPQPTPTADLTSNQGPLTLSVLEYNGSGNVTLGTSCPGTQSFAYYSAADVGSLAAPHVCYDQSGTITSGLPYYAVVQANAGTTVLDQFFIAPMIVNDPVTGSSTLCGTSSYQCIELAEYGYGLADSVTATVTSGPCEVAGFSNTFAGGTYVANGAIGGFSSPEVSYVDGNGYAQFALGASGDGTCYVTYQMDPSSPYAGPLLTEAYTITGSGSNGSPFTITVFGHTRRPR